MTPPPPLELKSPTHLVIRFPPSSSLPSQPKLRARLARFELLNKDQVSVNWSEHLCQVRFKYKKNTLEACNYAKGTDLFRKGQQMTYKLAPPPSSSLQPVPQLNQGTMSLMSRPPTQNNLQLKSILKKPKPPQSSTPQPSSPLMSGLQPPRPPLPPPQHQYHGANGVNNSNNNKDTFSDQHFLGLMTQAKE